MRSGLKRTLAFVLAVLLTVSVMPLETVNAATGATAAEKAVSVTGDLPGVVVTNSNGASDKDDSKDVKITKTGEDTFVTESGVEITVEKSSDNYTEDEKSGKNHSHALGDNYIDYTPEASSVGIDENILKADGTEVEIPSKWTISDNKLVSAVKNQGHYGCCWSMSMMAMAEAQDMKLNGAKADETNFSEMHLVNFFYGNELPGPDGGIEGDYNAGEKMTTTPQMGGNNYLSAQTVMSWKGVAKENVDPSLEFPVGKPDDYEPNLDDSLAYKDALHATNAFAFNVENTDLIKKHIMEYGAVGMSYSSIDQCSKEGSFDGEVSEYKGLIFYPKEFDQNLEKFECSEFMYEPGDGIIGPGDGGHAITIVGWDDDFDRAYFADTDANRKRSYTVYKGNGEKVNLNVSEPVLPEKNGAWLMKNSWGTGYGDDGFYWISYEDAGINTIMGFVYENADAKDHNYQYDGSCSGGALSLKLGSSPEIANVFTIDPYAVKNQKLDSVAVGVNSADTVLDVAIYENPKDAGIPESGTLISETKGFITSVPGYYNIPLATQPVVTPGTNIAVVVTPKFVEASPEKDSISLRCDMDEDNFWVKAVSSINKGQSFYGLIDSDSGKRKWVDIADTEFKGNFRIKLYTNDTDEAKSGVDISPAEVAVSYSKGKLSFTYTGKAVTPAAVVKLGENTLVEGTDYVLQYVNNVNAGEGIIRVLGTGEFSGVKEEKFVIDKKASKANDFKGLLEMSNGTAKFTVYNKSGKVADTDYVIDSIKDSNGSQVTLDKVSEDNLYTVEATLNNYVFGSAKNSTLYFNNVICKPDSKLIVELADPKAVSENCIYSGRAFKPAVVVKSNGEVLPKKAYKATYYNNKNAGTALIVVAGKGAYRGYTGICSFEIGKKEINQDNAAIGLASSKKLVYNGKNLLPKIKAKDANGKLLKLNRDFKLSYKNCKNAGDKTASAILKFNENYRVISANGIISTNSVVVPYSIEKAKITSVKSNGTNYITRLKDGKYHSENIGAIVKAGKLTLKPRDYKVVLENLDETNKRLAVKVISNNPNIESGRTAYIKLDKEKLKNMYVQDVSVPYAGGLYYNDICDVNISSTETNYCYITAENDKNIKATIQKGVKPGTYKIKLTATKANPYLKGSITCKYEMTKCPLNSSNIVLAGKILPDKGSDYTKQELVDIFSSERQMRGLTLVNIFNDSCDVKPVVRTTGGAKYIEVYANENSKYFTGSVKIKLQ